MLYVSLLSVSWPSLSSMALTNLLKKWNNLETLRYWIFTAPLQIFSPLSFPQIYLPIFRQSPSFSANFQQRRAPIFRPISGFCWRSGSTESGVGVGSRRPDCAGFERSRELGGWVVEKPGRSGRRRTVELGVGRSGTVELNRNKDEKGLDFLFS
jgi:hypothetical protein